MEKIKILEVIDSYYPVIDGAIGVAKYYSKNLNNIADCDLAVPAADKKSNYVDNENFKVIRVKSMAAPEGYRLARPKRDKEFKKALKEGNYDIIHTHSPFSLGKYVLKFAKKNNIPVVATLHTKYYDDFKRVVKVGFLAKIYLNHVMKVFKKADYVWTVSEGAKRVLRSYGYKGDVKIIRNGTDYVYPDNAQELIDRIDNKHNLKGQKNVLVFVGRMAMYKNLGLICDAIKLLKDSGADFKMLFVGGGFDFETLKAYVKKVGIEDCCILTGPVNDKETIQAYYLRSDLLVFPSTFDMASVTKFEAAAHKTPTILVEGSNSDEGTIHNVDGFLCQENAESLFNELKKICNTEGLAKEVGERAYTDIYRNWSMVSEEVLKTYKEHIREYKEKLNNE